jgi:beta-lactamase superfamily II metal-dependent hydrolase
MSARQIKKPKSRSRAAQEKNVPTQAPDEASKDAAFARGSIVVRMYRDILGDCFLLRFPAEGKTVHMLIDCGMLQGMPGAKENARRIMSNVASLTRRLDILVVTHEHVDHLSCFAQAKDIFEGIDVDELWLAWTEDSRDEQAARLRKGRQQAMALLEQSYAALEGLLTNTPLKHESDDEDSSAAELSALEGLRGLMAFPGRDPQQPLEFAAAKTSTILDDLQTKAKKVRFLTPGMDAFPLADAREITTYVLGPPRDECSLKRSNPRKGKSEVYELTAESVQEDVFLVAALGRAADEAQWSADDTERLKLSLPFGFADLILTELKSQSFGARNVPKALEAFRQIYERPSEQWRRIDTDWLGAAEQLALKLDSDTNNTSLVLAIEIGTGAESRVLLFPGDAQIGNWLSWGEYVWPVRKEVDSSSVTVEDLLEKTILYKVGHHGSQNATARERGLELMTSRDLVAMIPVQQEFANEVRNWNMPFPSLLKRLEEKTGGRVIRADRGKDYLISGANDRAGRMGELTRADWNQLLDCVRDVSDVEGPLAIEYRID